MLALAAVFGGIFCEREKVAIIGGHMAIKDGETLECTVT